MMETFYFTLEDKLPVPCKDVGEWMMWQSFHDNRVGSDQVGNIRVGTIFTGINTSAEGERPLLFETAIIKGANVRIVAKYSTWEEAEDGHLAILDKVKAEMN